MKNINEKINEEIKKIKDFAEERKGILLVALLVAVLIFLMGLSVYFNRTGKIEKIETERNCHYEAIEKAQEKYKNEILESSQCFFCDDDEDAETYRKQDYKAYYQECLNENIK